MIIKNVPELHHLSFYKMRSSGCFSEGVNTYTRGNRCFIIRGTHVETNILPDSFFSRAASNKPLLGVLPADVQLVGALVYALEHCGLLSLDSGTAITNRVADASATIGDMDEWLDVLELLTARTIPIPAALKRSAKKAFAANFAAWKAWFPERQLPGDWEDAMDSVTS